MWSIPIIWAGVLLQGYLTNAEYLKWFPTTGLHELEAEAMTFLPSSGPYGFERGWLLDTLWHLVLPVICLSYGSVAFLSKLSRGAILDTISADYVRTARAKGVPERSVLYVHVLRNSLLPMITVLAHLLPALLAGSVVVETIFGLPGMGKLIVDAVSDRDRELVLSETLVAGILGLISYLLADIGYAVADPRVSYE
jgi:peptide/nickel transport system permease protein